MKEFKIEHLTQTIGTKTLFNSIDLSIMENQKLGLIGVNGTGKTTFLNTITGQTKADDGTISSPKDYKISYLKQKNTLDPYLTILDTVYDSNDEMMHTVKEYEKVLAELTDNPMDETVQDKFTKVEARMSAADAWNASTEAKTILTKLGLEDTDKKIGSLSGGQQKRAALAQVLLQNSDLLILDEPTNHLDYDMIEWLENYLVSYKGSVLLVTHDRYFLDRVVNRILELDNGNLYQYEGNYQAYIEQKAEREEQEAQEAHKNKQLYKQELAWMREGVRARGTKQQARKNRFEDLQETVQNTTEKTTIDMNLKGSRLGKKVIEFEEASFSRGDQVILDNFDLLVQNKDRIGITGENASGKTTFLNVLTERIPLDSGTLTIGETVKIAYYTQTNEGMDGEKRVINFLREIAEEVQMADGSTANVAQLLEQFQFNRESQSSYIKSLSGGEKRRLYLIKLLMQQPNVLILDEPTNDLDIQTLTILEEYIRTFSGAVIAVSHDRYFLDKIASKLLVFKGQGQVETYYGKMTSYLAEEKEKSAEKPKPKKDTAKTNKKTKTSNEKTTLTYKEKQEWETIETDIMELEEEQEGLEQEMVGAGSDYGKINELNRKLEDIEQKINDKMARWDYLSNFVND